MPSHHSPMVPVVFTFSWKHIINATFALLVTFLCFTIPLYMEDAAYNKGDNLKGYDPLRDTDAFIANLAKSDEGFLSSVGGSIKNFAGWWFSSPSPTMASKNEKGTESQSVGSSSLLQESRLEHKLDGTLVGPGMEATRTTGVLTDMGTSNTVHFHATVADRVRSQLEASFYTTDTTILTFRLIETLIQLKPTPTRFGVGVATSAAHHYGAAVWASYLASGRNRILSWKPRSAENVDVQPTLVRFNGGVHLYAPGTEEDRKVLVKSLNANALGITNANSKDVVEEKVLNLYGASTALGEAAEADHAKRFAVGQRCHKKLKRLCGPSLARDDGDDERKHTAATLSLESWSEKAAASLEIVVVDHGAFGNGLSVLSLRATLPLVSKQHTRGSSASHVLMLWYGNDEDATNSHQVRTMLERSVNRGNAIVTPLGCCRTARRGDPLQHSVESPQEWDALEAALGANSSTKLEGCNSRLAGKELHPTCVLWIHAHEAPKGLSANYLKHGGVGGMLRNRFGVSSASGKNEGERLNGKLKSPGLGKTTWDMLSDYALLLAGTGVGAALCYGIVKNFRASGKRRGGKRGGGGGSSSRPV